MRPDRAAERRFAAWHHKVTAERDLSAVVLAGMDLWRTTVYAAITEQQPDRDQILAGGFFQHLWRLDNAAAAARTWLRWVDGAVAPSISAVFGEAFNTVRKTATISPQPYEAAHMADVHDRLVIWPDGAFEELRPELEEALSEAESIGQVQDRVGAVLGIDKQTREHRARINEINRILDDPDADPADRADLLTEKAQLWRDHDDSLEDWEWKARRIARTEIQGAVEAGQYEAARASESQLGITLYKRWIATPDTRTRHSHWLADGQVVRLAERFTVGATQLLYPADPSSGDASEIINCRCSLAYQEPDEVQAELQGPDGAPLTRDPAKRVNPQMVRMGPDDPAIVADKIATLEKNDDQHDDGREPDWAPPLIPASPTPPPHVDNNPHPHGVPKWTEEERARRQLAALPDFFPSEPLFQHEIEFVERFKTRGETVQWIPKGQGDPITGNTPSTSDFLWRSNFSLPTEVKSTKATAPAARNAIKRAVERSINNPVSPRKENFIIDFGPATLKPGVRNTLSHYNGNNLNYQINRLWIMHSDGAGFEEIRLRT